MQDNHEDVTLLAATNNINNTAVSVVVEHRPNQQLQIAVSALVPRKRTGADDVVTSKLVHYLFWDDKRYCTHLDALLTRLAPLSVVHLASTERAELPSSKNPSAAVVRRVQQVSALLDKLAQLVSSRTDLSTGNHDDDDDNNNNLVHIHRNNHTVPKQNDDLEDVLQHVLDESSHLAFRGVVLDDIIQKSISLLLRGQGIHHTAAAHSISLEQGVLSSHLVLDRTASQAIHLLPPATAAGTTPSPSCSLYGIFNRCRTTMGSRNLKAWLRQPLVDLEAIQQRQEAVTFLLTTVDRIRDEGLQGWPDVDALAARLEGYKEEVTGPTSRALSCLYKLYLLTIQQVPVLCEALQDVLLGTTEGTNNTGLLKECQEGFLSVQEELSRSQQLVEAVLDLEEAPRNYFVKATFSDEMLQIKQELDGLDAEFDVCLEGMNQAWCDVSGNRNVKLESFESGDFQFRLPNTNDSKLLQAHFQGITLHKLLKNGVYFSTKDLRQLSTKKQDLVEEYDKHQREIMVNAMKVAATYAPVLEKTSALVAQLDCLCSLAHVAAYSPNTYCRPILTDGEDDGLGIELKGARHPCVELQESMEYIPNDISLVFGESSFLMVTGPNMGGKSTYIRALGAIVTLAQIGAYVPCTSARINIVHHILARVGAGDVQDRGISTFMAEMLEASSILKTATKRSLIIIDELGRGTSTFDGFGLATAISEYIIQKLGCMTVFATHFHELTALEERCVVAKNCHVTATTAGKNGLTFMYEVRPGPCLESFGIQVAEMAHVPPVVVADAKRRAKHLENFDYRKKRKQENEHFLQKFRQIPMDSLSGEEKKQALLRLLQ